MSSVGTAELAILSELIDTIYQGATEPDRWNNVLPAIANWLNAPKGLLFTPQHPIDQGGFYFSHALPDMMMQLWATKYHAKDVWAIRGVERGLITEGNVILGDEDLIPQEEFLRTEVYQELLSKVDIVHLLSSIVFGNGSPANIPWAVCALYRGLKEPKFTSFEKERFAIIVPHISRALGVMMRLKDMGLKVASSLSALDRLGSSVLLFGERGQVTFANKMALRLLEEQDGLRLKHAFGNSSFGDIIAGDKNAQLALVAAIRNAVSPNILNTGHFSRAVRIPRPSGRVDYLINFSSLASSNDFASGSDSPRAIAFITDSAAPVRLDAEILKRTYGLTPAEIRLMEAMAECLTLEEAADRFGVSRGTVKTQLLNVYGKTNTNSRAKLIRLIMSLMQQDD